MNRAARHLLAIALCSGMAMSLASSATAREDPKRRLSKVSQSEPRTGADRDTWSRDPVGFSARDRETIRNYFSAADAASHRDFDERHGALPPGVRKHLQRNGTVPPALQRRIEPLAADLDRRLPRLYSGYSRGILGQDLVIVEDRTHRVMDIVRDATVRR